jgi:glycosyltransferase involved in cell wall biosynthesis
MTNGTSHSSETHQHPKVPALPPLPTPSAAQEISSVSSVFPRIFVVIPAYNEERSLGTVLQHIPQSLAATVIVADNASTDATAAIAQQHGAVVVHEPERGYGAACLRALSAVREMINSKRQRQAPTAAISEPIVVFVDADYSDTPEEMTELLKPLLHGAADVVIGSRVLGIQRGMVEHGALLPQARLGNWLATRLIRWRWGYAFTDLGPFRAVRWDALEQMAMEDRNFGWTVEMQIKAAMKGLRCAEVPVSYRKRIGVSKITGTVKGTIKAGVKILWTIARYGISRYGTK